MTKSQQASRNTTADFRSRATRRKLKLAEEAKPKKAPKIDTLITAKALRLDGV